jgi:hypothetical protein
VDAARSSVAPDTEYLMATDNPSSAVATVAIVILVLAALIGGYMFFGPDGSNRGDGNDIRIDMPDGKKNR